MLGSETGRNLVGDGGNFLQGAGQALGEGVLGSAVGGVGNLGGGVGSIVSGVSSLREGSTASGLGDLVGGGMGLASMVTDSVPYLGTIGNAVSTAGHAVEAYNSADQIGGDWTGNKFWTETGATTLGAVNTLASLDPTGLSSMVASGVQGGVNMAGAASGWLGQKVLGADTSFSAPSMVGAGERALYNTASTIGTGISGLYNWVTG